MESADNSAGNHVYEFLGEGIPMLQIFRNIVARSDEDGASAVEYGLLVAGIAALIVAIVFLFGGVIRDVFQGTCQTIADSAGGASSCA